MLPELSRFIFGTARLRGDAIPLADRVKVVRAAMDAGVWFHASQQYANALEVLRAAFDEDPKNIPRMIFKIGWKSMSEMKSVIDENLKRAGVDHIDIGQLCLEGELAKQFRTGGACYEELSRLKEQGIVRSFILEIFPWSSAMAIDVIRGGYCREIVDGYIF
jgi:predicted aldo/keto reductase-like oxidoreductase